MRYIAMTFKRSTSIFPAEIIRIGLLAVCFSRVLFYSIDLMPMDETLAFQTHTHTHKEVLSIERKYCELVCENDSL